MQNFSKKDQYKKMQSRKISSHEEESEGEKSRDSSEAEETKRQMLSQPQKKDRSKSRGPVVRK